MRTLLTLALVLALGLFFTGCKDDDAPDAPPTEGEVEKAAGDAADKAEEGAKKVEEEADEAAKKIGG